MQKNIHVVHAWSPMVIISRASQNIFAMLQKLEGHSTIYFIMIQYRISLDANDTFKPI